MKYIPKYALMNVHYSEMSRRPLGRHLLHLAKKTSIRIWMFDLWVTRKINKTINNSHLKQFYWWECIQNANQF